MESYCFGNKDSTLFCAPLLATRVATPTLLLIARNVVEGSRVKNEWQVGAMASRPVENLVLLTVSTCGRGGAELGSDEKEICSLTWQVIDTAKIQPASAIEHVYVCPEELPQDGLTPVGIDVAKFSQAPSLSERLKQLQHVISSLPANSYCLATNGMLPLRQCLFSELRKKGIQIYPFLYKYFDLQNELCKRSANEFQPHSLRDLCEFLGVECPSEEVYGEEEIAVLAKVVQKMLSQGHVFESPETIQQSFPSSSTEIDPASMGQGCVVRMRGLPFQADHQDVANFLAGLNIIPNGLVFGINAVGRRTGEALAVLETPEQANLALQRDHHYIQQRYIEVYESSPEDFLEMAGSASAGDTDASVFVVRMQGLPYRAKEEDIVDFFGQDSPVKDQENGVLIVRFPNGRASGDAFALFDTEEDMECALKKDRRDMQGRYIELFRSSLKEFLLVLNKSGSQEQFDQFSYLNLDTSSRRGAERNCVKLRGLPWSATAEDVIEFFEDLSKHIEQHGVHMVLNSQNRPTGDCYVQMSSVEAASKASDRLHKRNMGSRYIEVFQCSGTEVTYALMDSAGARSGTSSSSYSSRAGGKRRRASGATVKARGLPYRTSEYDLVEFFSDFCIDAGDVEIVYDQAGRSTGIAYISFPCPTDAKKAVRDLNNKYIGHRYVELSLA